MAMASGRVRRPRFSVNVVEVFDVFVKFLIARENIIWIHPDLRAGKIIHKPYFSYASGDIIMCGCRNTDMCANLLQRGVFSAPLKYGTAPRVGKTIDSALEYCHKLLEEGGTCERTLPSTYSVWKKSSATQCRCSRPSSSASTCLQCLGSASPSAPSSSGSRASRASTPAARWSAGRARPMLAPRRRERKRSRPSAASQTGTATPWCCSRWSASSCCSFSHGSV
mmetsp:Transcript_146654/g.470584  ORF Transcript_146654/g.470584 Transcript_146654/m.470584 type:complete len:224 (-) Transcript_146654:533-1204(-)